MSDDREEIEPATPFMEGYRRSGDVTQQIIIELATAIMRNQTQRVGQLLINVSREQDLFNIWDEDLLHLLKEANK